MSRNFGRWLVLVAITTLLVALLIAGQGLAQNGASDEQQLGELLYFDENLSDPAGQSCASCHAPQFGFVDPTRGRPVSEGVVKGLFGNRNAPSAGYAMYAPVFDGEIGGQFWDGRATGGDPPIADPLPDPRLADPLADQALRPFLNPVEQNNASFSDLVDKVLASSYSSWFVDVCGADPADDYELYKCIGNFIAAFERTELFAPFTSKYDFYVMTCLEAGGDPAACAVGDEADSGVLAAKSLLSPAEWRGMQLFMNETNDNNGVLDAGEGAACILCHVADWADSSQYEFDVVVPDWSADLDLDIPPMFTDFTYDNLGVPKSNHKLLRDIADPDLGLGGWTGNLDEYGLFKVMTLRNIAVTGPYAHNGFFRSLEDITHFYNTRDDGSWPLPEVGVNVNVEELGNLGLSRADEVAVVLFMRTLSDGHAYWIR